MTSIFAYQVGLTFASGAGASVSRFISSLSVQVPEPGMMLLFGIGAAALGLTIGRGKRR